MKHKLTKIFNKYVGQFLVARLTKARSSRCDLATVVPECLTNHACKLPITAAKITQNIYQPVCKENFTLTLCSLKTSYMASHILVLTWCHNGLLPKQHQAIIGAKDDISVINENIRKA